MNITFKSRQTRANDTHMFRALEVRSIRCSLEAQTALSLCTAVAAGKSTRDSNLYCRLFSPLPPALLSSNCRRAGALYLLSNDHMVSFYKHKGLDQNIPCINVKLHETSVNPRVLRHGENCDYTLSSFKHGNKNEIQKSIF